MLFVQVSQAAGAAAGVQSNQAVTLISQPGVHLIQQAISSSNTQQQQQQLSLQQFQQQIQQQHLQQQLQQQQQQQPQQPPVSSLAAQQPVLVCIHS